MENTMAKTDAVKAKSNGATEVATSLMKITFLADTNIPERKALGRKQGSGQWIEVAKALGAHPGKVAPLLHDTDPKVLNARRTALINAATSVGIEMWLEKTAVRDSGKREGDKIVFTLFASAATDEVKKLQAEERKKKAANLLKLALAKGFKDVESYKASLPKRGPAKKTEGQSEANKTAQA